MIAFVILFGFADAVYAQDSSVKLSIRPNSTNEDAQSQLLNGDSLLATINLPDFIKEAEITGTVLIRILVNEAGHYERHEVLRSPHPILTALFVAILPDLRWKPFVLEDGKPGCVWVTLPFRLYLQD